MIERGLLLRGAHGDSKSWSNSQTGRRATADAWLAACEQFVGRGAELEVILVWTLETVTQVGRPPMKRSGNPPRNAGVTRCRTRARGCRGSRSFLVAGLRTSWQLSTFVDDLHVSRPTLRSRESSDVERRGARGVDAELADGLLDH